MYLPPPVFLIVDRSTTTTLNIDSCVGHHYDNPVAVFVTPLQTGDKYI